MVHPWGGRRAGTFGQLSVRRRSRRRSRVVSARIGCSGGTIALMTSNYAPAARGRDRRRHRRSPPRAVAGDDRRAPAGHRRLRPVPGDVPRQHGSRADPRRAPPPAPPRRLRRDHQCIADHHEDAAHHRPPPRHGRAGHAGRRLEPAGPVGPIGPIGLVGAIMQAVTHGEIPRLTGSGPDPAPEVHEVDRQQQVRSARTSSGVPDATTRWSSREDDAPVGEPVERVEVVGGEHDRLARRVAARR